MTLRTATAIIAFLAAATVSAPVTANATIEHVRIVFDRKSSHIEVTQMFRLRRTDGQDTAKRNPYSIALPIGATGPRLVGDEQTGIELRADRVVFGNPIAAEGSSIALRFNLPLQDDSVLLDQQLSSPLESAEVISTWTAGKISLTGKGFQAAEVHQLSNGLEGIVMLGRNIPNGILSISLSGLTDGPEKWRRLITFLLSAALLAAGLLIWFRDRMTGRQNKHH